MKPDWQASRTGLLWLLVCFVAIVAGLSADLPLWVMLAIFFALLWRVQVYRGAWNYPSGRVKLALIVFCVAGLLLSYQRLAGLEPLTALLVIAFALKLLEMHQRRDALILVFVAYFLATVLLLYEQTIGRALYALFCIFLGTTALNGFHQSDAGGIWLPLRRAGVLITQSLPLMLVLFLVMPRLGAFWSVPSSQKQGKTGVSGEMAPGDLSKLGKNGEIAFRVTFDGEMPEPSRLYWRGPVLSHFDGRTWRQGKPWYHDDGPHIQWQASERAAWRTRVTWADKPITYSVVIEPTQRHWLFALAAPEPVSPRVGLTRELRLVSREPVNRKFQYRVRSWPTYRYFADKLHPRERRQALQLPDDFNPKARELAGRWRAESNDTQAYIRKVLAWYHREFVYTLEPPILGTHTVDEFLFEDLRGFCSHFSGSFVFLMRAAGVPARVVTGYQGGERHPKGEYMLVYQYNAHAWAEVWLPGAGWVRVDPTAAVAPERIEAGFEAFFGGQDDFLSDTPFGLNRFRGINWINQIRLHLDSLDFYWAKWVLGYEEVQSSFLTRLLGGVDPLRIALFVFVIAGLFVVVVAVSLLRGNLGHPKIDAVDKSFARLCQKLASAGLPRETGEGPGNYRMRLQKCEVRSAREATRLLKMYEKIRYAGQLKLSADFHLAVKRFRV